jgi:hypothetical protein|tara:strand:+ start:613 stop:846 length:234 start_codon:yes stop_codon:yes gene_type:complete
MQATQTVLTWSPLLLSPSLTVAAHRPKAAQTVTIFDWDDTLLCTTHLETLQRQALFSHGHINSFNLASFEECMRNKA